MADKEKKNSSAKKPKPSPYRFYVNREMSWLEFNLRVLMEAADTSVPLLERLKFLAIYQSNLDEFYRVRVGILTHRAQLTPDMIDTVSGWTPAEQIVHIQEKVAEQRSVADSIWKKLKSEFIDAGIDVMDFRKMAKVDELMCKKVFGDIKHQLTPQILENFYNIADKRTEGRRQVVATFKGVGGRYDSFQNSPELLPLVDRSLVKSTEFYTEDDIMAFPFQTEVSLQEWHYKAGAPYRPASEIILRLMQNVSRNGSLLLNITQRGRGNIDPEARQICEDIGRWLDVNGAAVYGSRPFDCWGDEHVLYTRKDGRIYVTLIDWNGEDITLAPLSSNAPSVGKVRKVRLLGDRKARFRFKQTPEGLVIKVRRLGKNSSDIKDETLAASFKVLEISHTKGWFNDDDPGVSTIGWDRVCNLGQGDFNNDLYVTSTEGDVWETSFKGRKVTVLAPTGPEYGTMRIILDGMDCGAVNLQNGANLSHQQKVFSYRCKKRGDHRIQIVCYSGRAAIDALVIK